MAIVLAAAACVSWGVAVFLGGTTARRLGTFSALLFAQPLAVAVFAALVVGWRGGPPGQPRLLFAVAAGVVGLVGLACFYRAMAVGKISIVAPIAASTAVLPVVVGLALGERPSIPQLVGMVLVLVGIALVSVERSSAGGRLRLLAGVGLAVLAALSFGAFFLLVKVASAADPYWTTLLQRATLTVVLFAIAFLYLVQHRAIASPAGNRRLILTLVAIGLLGVGGDLFFAIATTRGLLSLVSVIGAMYPAVAVGLAAILLKERISRYQTVGVASALLGIALLSAV